MRYTVIYVNYLGSCAAIPLKEVNLCIKLTIKEVFIRGFRPRSYCLGVQRVDKRRKKIDLVMYTVVRD